MWILGEYSQLSCESVKLNKSGYKVSSLEKEWLKLEFMLKRGFQRHCQCFQAKETKTQLGSCPKCRSFQLWC